MAVVAPVLIPLPESLVVCQQGVTLVAGEARQVGEVAVGGVESELAGCEEER